MIWAQGEMSHEVEELVGAFEARRFKPPGQPTQCEDQAQQVRKAGGMV